jgi:hypothetical protein
MIVDRTLIARMDIIGLILVKVFPAKIALKSVLKQNASHVYWGSHTRGQQNNA